MSQAEVLEYLEENGPATRKELYKALEASKQRVDHNLKNLYKWEGYYDIQNHKNDSGREVWNVTKKNNRR